MGTYSSVEELSRTQLAVLYCARHRLSGVLYCLKRSMCEYELERVHGGTISEVYNEVQALSLLRHPNVIRYYSSWFETDSIFLQMEYCLGGSLFHYLHPDRSLDTSEALRPGQFSPPIPEHVADSTAPELPLRRLSEAALTMLMVHVISALHYMHANWSMVHGDVKPSNILIQLNKPEAYLASANERIVRDVKEHCHTVS